MVEKKDRRSKRDRLKDGIINGLNERIETMERACQQRSTMNEADAIVVSILKDQISNINRLCEEEGSDRKP